MSIDQKSTEQPGHDTPDEAAIVQHMRESGMLPRWAPESCPNGDCWRLVLAGGMAITLTRNVTTYARVVVPNPDYCHSRTDMDEIARRLPGFLLPIFREAVADLERLAADVGEA